ncbi:MAG: exonuclease SbcCD subunit D [Bacteriovoracaceae bacterium]|nr:exonuclease SbcCD subunit D [Bacteriovoracaceae bacterium]
MLIKILHTADWHLGKKLFQNERLSEQVLFLHWLKNKIQNEQTDLLLISGDIFDTPLPPVAALKAFYDFLASVTASSACHILVIAGNHDSGHFLEAPISLITNKQVTLVGQIHRDLSRHHQVIKIKNKTLLISCLPYFRSHDLYQWTQASELSDGETTKALEMFFHSSIQAAPQSDYRILMAHHLFGQFEYSGSEQVVGLSGLNSIPRSLYQNYYDYLALGHIHKKQIIDREPLSIYPGSPISMRFSESHQKFLSEIVIGETVTQSFHAIPQHRRLYQLKTTEETLDRDLKNLMKEMTETSYTLTNYLEVELFLKSPKSGMADYIREKLKGQPIELLSYSTELHQTEQKARKIQTKKLSIMELFEQYYLTKFPETEQIPTELVQDFNRLIHQAEVSKHEVE